MPRFLIASVSALALAACATGPDYVAPKPPQSASAAFISTSPAATLAAPAEDWWQLYRDPVLDGLIGDALAANTDIRVAVARLAKARAALREVRNDRTPQANLGASATYGRYSAIQTPPGANREDWTVDTGLDVSYEVDLFGRISRGVEAALADVGAADADADAVRVSIVAETTRAYADAAAAAERLAVAQRIVELLDRSLKVTQRRVEVGMTTPLDSARIAALRNQRQADVPSIAAERQAALFRLAMLTGRTPQDLPAIAAERGTTLRLDQPIPVGDGAALLARRPDVRAAERQLAAATARIGVATADLYPRITLGGSIGSTGTGLGNLFGGGPLNWLLGPLLNWNLNQGKARARIAGAEADSQAALATFDGTVLTALEETETALSNYAKALDRRTALQAARDQAAVAARITRAQQREGQIDSLAQLDAERTFADTEATLALADAQIARAQIDLFRALGGNWRGAQT
ncbi:efflux transporter outer membrane subunit [Sphingomonas sp. SUN019]|uniref:efflux transporter outer membrane subunit n=1 Tax=Sphingomonas sp. SUN019 TaxID=2937788 RepID=UPI0021648BB0|nr:efflux transporter outer membrane subunit [Sphingomonas sp. SUN019]UVO50194.1 efflux transporter outer membrane subunit [Sphingomonas sp. SUN019]